MKCTLGFRVGGNPKFEILVGGNVNFSVFVYQHVGTSKAKLWRLGSKPMPRPNANGFALQWNIGFNFKNALVALLNKKV